MPEYLDIIPLIRGPKKISSLTYRVPESFDEKKTKAGLPAEAPTTVGAKAGQIVEMPFRNKKILGLVKRVLPQQETAQMLAKTAVKDITGIQNPIPFLSDVHVQLIERTAEWYGAGVGTMARMILPPLQKRMLKTFPLLPFSSFKKNKKPSSQKPVHYSSYANQEEHAQMLIRAIGKTTLILVPEMRLINEVFELLQKDIQAKTTCWHGSLSPKEQRERWIAIRNGEAMVVIGTRGALFLPFPSLESIIIDYEHDENHKHWDQTPRFHAKDAALLWQELAGTRLSFMSFSPSCESYYFTAKKMWKSAGSIPPTLDKNSLVFIDVQNERRGGNFGPISSLVEDAIRDEKAGDIFLYLNRLGFARSFGCNACGFVKSCSVCSLPLTYYEGKKELRCHGCNRTEALSLICPRCGGAMLKLRGAGIERVEQLVQNIMGKSSSHDVIRIDTDREYKAKDATRPQIIIGTRAAFKYIRWGKTSHIVFVDPDKELALPEYASAERMRHAMQEVLFRKRPSASFFIQTFTPDHPLFRSFTDPDRWYRTDLSHRRTLHYPPYAYLVRYMVGAPEKKEAEQKARRLFQALTSVLTLHQNGTGLTEQKSLGILYSPVEMQPQFFRNTYWYVILLKADPTQWQTLLPALNGHVPDDVRIDPNPIHLFQP